MGSWRKLSALALQTFVQLCVLTLDLRGNSQAFLFNSIFLAVLRDSINFHYELYLPLSS